MYYNPVLFQSVNKICFKLRTFHFLLLFFFLGGGDFFDLELE